MDSKTKILYVDDESINLQLFKINFRKKYDILLAESGIDGLKILENAPDVTIVISDMKIPKMNGIEFIQTAKEMFGGIKYFILTGFDITPEIKQALDDKLILKYFSKPFNQHEIDNSISEVLN